MALWLLLSVSCTSDNNEDQTPSISERVKAAKLIPNHVPMDDPRPGIIYIEIPGRNAYVSFRTESEEEKWALTDAVYQRFQSDFESSSTFDRSVTLNESVESFGFDCGDWYAIDPSNPNTRVYRYCCNFQTGRCYRETCDCGYCCK